MSFVSNDSFDLFSVYVLYVMTTDDAQYSVKIDSPYFQYY